MKTLSLLDDPALASCCEKEKLFVIAYATPGPSFGNATRAAEFAGVNASTYASLRAQGYQIKNRIHVREAIREFLGRRVMTAEEALVRLSDIARGPLNQLASIVENVDEEGNCSYDLKLNVAEALHNGYGHLIKELKETTKIDKDGNEVYSDSPDSCTSGRCSVESRDGRNASGLRRLGDAKVPEYLRLLGRRARSGVVPQKPSGHSRPDGLSTRFSVSVTS